MIVQDLYDSFSQAGISGVEISTQMKFTLPDGLTEEQIKAASEIISAHTGEESYRILRRYSYPDISEFADAVYWKEKGDSVPMSDYLAKCDDVRLKYKKTK